MSHPTRHDFLVESLTHTVAGDMSGPSIDSSESWISDTMLRRIQAEYLERDDPEGLIALGESVYEKLKLTGDPGDRAIVIMHLIFHGARHAESFSPTKMARWFTKAKAETEAIGEDDPRYGRLSNILGIEGGQWFEAQGNYDKAMRFYMGALQAINLGHVYPNFIRVAMMYLHLAMMKFSFITDDGQEVDSELLREVPETKDILKNIMATADVILNINDGSDFDDWAHRWTVRKTLEAILVLGSVDERAEFFQERKLLMLHQLTEQSHTYHLVDKYLTKGQLDKPDLEHRSTKGLPLDEVAFRQLTRAYHHESLGQTELAICFYREMLRNRGELFYLTKLAEAHIAELSEQTK